MAEDALKRWTRGCGPPRSGSSAPVFDAVMIGCEAVVDAPQNRLGTAGNADLAIDRPDVGLHGIRAEVGQRCHLSVALTLGDQRQDLRFAVSESLASPWPIQSADAACPETVGSLITISPAWIASRASTRSEAPARALDKYPWTPCLRALG